MLFGCCSSNAVSSSSLSSSSSSSSLSSSSSSSVTSTSVCRSRRALTCPPCGGMPCRTRACYWVSSSTVSEPGGSGAPLPCSPSHTSGTSRLEDSLKCVLCWASVTTNQWLIWSCNLGFVCSFTEQSTDGCNPKLFHHE